MKLAIFDLDHTLMPMDTGDCWVRFVATRSDIDRSEVYATLDRYAREYEEKTLDINEFMDFQMRFLARFSRKSLDGLLAEFLERWIKPNIPRTSLEAVAAHEKAGDMVALCSATNRYLTDPVGRFFGVRYNLSCEPERDGRGEFTGRLKGAHTYQEGKVRAARAFIAQKKAMGVAFDSLVFYSDSANDLPLFDYVAENGGECVAVNPSNALLQQAKRRGWSVRNFYAAADLQRVLEQVKATLR